MKTTGLKTPLTPIVAVLVLFAQAMPLHALVYCNMQDVTAETCVCGEAHAPGVAVASPSDQCCSVNPLEAEYPALGQGSCCDLQIVSQELTCTLPDTKLDVSPLICQDLHIFSPTLSYQVSLAPQERVHVPEVSLLQLSVFLC